MSVDQLLRVDAKRRNKSRDAMRSGNVTFSVAIQLNSGNCLAWRQFAIEWLMTDHS